MFACVLHFLLVQMSISYAMATKVQILSSLGEPSYVSLNSHEENKISMLVEVELSGSSEFGFIKVTTTIHGNMGVG